MFIASSMRIINLNVACNQYNKVQLHCIFISKITIVTIKSCVVRTINIDSIWMYFCYPYLQKYFQIVKNDCRKYKHYYGWIDKRNKEGPVSRVCKFYNFDLLTTYHQNKLAFCWVAKYICLLFIHWHSKYQRVNLFVSSCETSQLLEH